MRNSIFIDSLQIDGMVRSLAHSIEESICEYDQVVGIASGGTNISRRIAVLLGLQHHEVYISCYTDKGKRPYPIVRGDFDTSKRTLVIDDMIDGGSTIRLFKLHYGLKQSDGVAVLYWNTDAPEPDFFVEEKPDEWIIFSWECE